jgi:hypothetical protein
MLFNIVSHRTKSPNYMEKIRLELWKIKIKDYQLIIKVVKIFLTTK